jgi:hypothetical protein
MTTYTLHMVPESSGCWLVDREGFYRFYATRPADGDYLLGLLNRENAAPAENLLDCQPSSGLQ